MDTSETYIKMCDCEEIQKLVPNPSNEKEHDLGSFFWNETDGLLDMLVEDNDTGWWMIGSYSNEHCRFIWLPRQDQLQEMVDPHSSLAAFGELLGGIFTLPVGQWVRKSYYQRFASMEQLWLAFVMKELHGKVWTGEKWEKV